MTCSDIGEQDATMKRCYGKDVKIRDHNWDYLSQQRTIRAPREQMPRLQDLLECLAKPGSENVWLLLDIKVPPIYSILALTV